MRYFIPFLLLFFSTIIYGQNKTCNTLWEGEESDQQYYIGGFIDDIHVYRMFLCRKENKLRGYYEMVNSNKMTEVEGFLKGDSVFLAEYSPNQSVLGIMKGYFKDSTYTADMTTPGGAFTGNISGVLMKNWALCKNPALSDFAKIILYESEENPAQRMLISFPNDYACRGILYDADQKKTFYMSGKKPEQKEKQYKLTTLTRPVSGGKITCSLKEDRFIQSTFPGRRTNMTASISIPLRIIEKSDRVSAYEIHYPYTGDKNADKKIAAIVDDIRMEFDSMYHLISKLKDDDEVYGRSSNMSAWFEPSYVSQKWLCGHFIVHYNTTNESKVIPFNYNYTWNKDIDLEELISDADKETDWNAVIASQDGDSPDVKKVAAYFDDPVIAYRGVLLTSPFDRLYDRKLYQTDKKIKGIKWKWWKIDYWIFKSQQT